MIKMIDVKKSLILSCILLFWGSTYGQTHIDLKYKLPEWICLTYDKDKSFKSNFEISDYLNPFYLEGDFDGDSLIDIAIAIKEKSTQKRGILIVNRSNKEYFILGAGKKFERGGADFYWLDNWRVYRKKFIGSDEENQKRIKLKSVALYVEHSEAYSAVIYWNGTKYVWHQLAI